MMFYFCGASFFFSISLNFCSTYVSFCESYSEATKDFFNFESPDFIDWELESFPIKELFREGIILFEFLIY